MKTNQLIEQGIGIENGEKNLLDYLSKRKGGKTTTLNSSTSKDFRYVVNGFKLFINNWEIKIPIILEIK